MTDDGGSELVPEKSLRRALFELLDPEMNGAVTSLRLIAPKRQL